MADADEDRPITAAQNQEQDPSEETQDFRFLNSIINSSGHSTDAPSIPKRGEKDFEPNPTQSQAATLEASRDAMHTALSRPRLHQAKTHLIAQYCPDTPRGDCVARVDKAHGVLFRTMGQGDSKNRMWLLPEEALYLLERGSLDIRWSDLRNTDDDVEDEQDEPAIGELPMSLQGAYASFIGKSGLTLERYSVFTGLRRLGYTVQRAPTWDSSTAPMNGHASPPSPQPSTHPANHDRATHPNPYNLTHLINRLVRYLNTPDPRRASPATGPLVAPGLYRSYADIFRALALPASTLPPPPSVPKPPTPPFTITYHIWKPSNSLYRKSSPPAPDFRVCILDARATSVPTMSQITALLDSVPEDRLGREKAGLEQRIKYGRRNVVLAVVDMGVVSYLRMSDAGFGGEKLFENRGRGARKGKGKAGGGGQKGRGGGGGKGAVAKIETGTS